jgi:hypothetical protein
MNFKKHVNFKKHGRKHVTRVNILLQKGWGQKLVETREFKTYELAEVFVKDYNSEHNPPRDDTPDWYMYARIEGDTGFGMTRWTDEEWEKRKLELMEEDASLDPDRMDEDLYKNGNYVCMISGISKEEMNRICDDINKGPWEVKVDWHYAAGRIIVKSDSDPARVLPLLPQIQPA